MNSPVFKRTGIDAGGLATGNDQNMIRCGIIPGYKLPGLGKGPFHPLHQCDPIIFRAASAAILDPYFSSGDSTSFIPQRAFATRCFSFIFTWREIMMRWAWGDPAPCMDSVR